MDKYSRRKVLQTIAKGIAVATATKVISPFSHAQVTGAGFWKKKNVSLSFNYVASAYTLVVNSPTLTISSNAQAGDFAVISSVAINGLSLPANVTDPAGWTLASNAALVYMRSKVWCKVLTAGDIGATLNLLNGEGDGHRLLVFRPSKTISTVTPTAATRVTSGDPAALTLSISGLSTPLIAIGYHCVAAGSVPNRQTTSGSMTNFADSVATDVSYQIFNPPGTVGSNLIVDVADQANDNQLHGVYFSFT